MRRGRYGRSSSSYDYLSSLARITWPNVVRPALREHRSILEPQYHAAIASLEPTDLKAILNVTGEPAIQMIRRNLHDLGASPPRLSGSMPPEPTHPGNEPQSADYPSWTDYEPQTPKLSFLASMFDVVSGAASRREYHARRGFDAAKQEWDREHHQRERDVRTYRDALKRYENDIEEHKRTRSRLASELSEENERFALHKERYEKAQQADIAALNALLANAADGSESGIEALAQQILKAVPLPLAMDRNADVRFDPVDGILLLTVQLPNFEEIPLGVQLKTKRRDATEKERRAAQETVVHALPLRLIHEIFATTEMVAVQMVGVNMRLQYTDRRNGKRLDEIIASMAATRDEFANLNITEVDPKLCFRALKGVASPSFQDLSPVRPLLTFDKDDARIIESREVVDKLDSETNLAAMDWEDFEHVVRELFAKMFTARSSAAEVHVTRASRDYGVDALIHDPDPIYGGKFVIQAKRYVNTVDVAAVRDLFGTVQNEGANRGYLVTTSSFGPDAHQFAKGKPLTLIDGSHLLQLLRDHGYSFRINLQEARHILHGR